MWDKCDCFQKNPQQHHYKIINTNSSINTSNKVSHLHRLHCKLYKASAESKSGFTAWQRAEEILHGFTTYINNFILDYDFGFPQMINEYDQAILKMCVPPMERKAKANQALPKSLPDHTPACASHSCSFRQIYSKTAMPGTAEGEECVPWSRSSVVWKYWRFWASDVNQEQIICKECCKAEQYNRRLPENTPTAV